MQKEKKFSSDLAEKCRFLSLVRKSQMSSSFYSTLSEQNVKSLGFWKWPCFLQEPIFWPHSLSSQMKATDLYVWKMHFWPLPGQDWPFAGLYSLGKVLRLIWSFNILTSSLLRKIWPSWKCPVYLNHRFLLGVFITKVAAGLLCVINFVKTWSGRFLHRELLVLGKFCVSIQFLHTCSATVLAPSMLSIISDARERWLGPWTFASHSTYTTHPHVQRSTPTRNMFLQQKGMLIELVEFSLDFLPLMDSRFFYYFFHFKALEFFQNALNIHIWRCQLLSVRLEVSSSFLTR